MYIIKIWYQILRYFKSWRLRFKKLHCCTNKTQEPLKSDVEKRFQRQAAFATY